MYKDISRNYNTTSIYQPLPTQTSPFSNFPPLSGDVCSDPQQQPPLGAAPGRDVCLKMVVCYPINDGKTHIYVG